MNFPKNLRLCRLCLLHKDSFVNIHEPNDRYGFVVVDEINELLQLNITPGDGLPEGICYDCLYDLSHFKRFKKVSHEAEITLKYILTHDVENGGPNENAVGVLECESNGYGNEDVDPLLDTDPSNSHSGNLRRDVEGHSLDGEDVAEDADVALMCEATLSEVEETLPMNGEVDIVRRNLPIKGEVDIKRSIKFERGAHCSQQRQELSNNVFSIVREQVKTKKIKSEASGRQNLIPPDVNSLNTQSGYKCTDCLAVFPDEYSFRSHISSSECSPLYVCSVCNESFMNNACLIEHNLNYHADESQECDSKDQKVALTIKRGFVCDECGSCFRKKIVFEHHMLINHARELAYKCKICWKSFVTKGGLKEHLVVHSTERPFVCEICGSAFKLRKKLLRHVRNCHSEK